MKLSQRTPSRRGGFTLIELLVVIAIILLLVGLLAAGVSRAIVKGQELRNRNDIMQLEMGVQAFKTQYGFYPPSRIILAERQGDFPANLLGQDSQYYLSTMFPRLTLPAAPGFLDWNASGSYTAPPADGSYSTTILFGDQCLVFFLGGITGMNGFNTNPTNPTLGGGGGGQGTFFEFQASRLVVPPGRSQFPVYVDNYKSQPYLYFSSYKAAHGYLRYTPPPTPGNPIGVSSDCPQIPSGPYLQTNAPYMQTPNGPALASTGGPFWKPNSFQIISAGRDKVFGDMLQDPRNPRSCTQVYTAGDISVNATNLVSGAQDDQTNFAPGVLGGGQ